MNERSRRVIAPVLGGGLLAANVGWGLAVLNWSDDVEDVDPFHVLVVQTNLPQDNKIGWTIEQQKVDLPVFFELTEQGLDAATNAGIEVDLVVWPETMLPGAGIESDTVQMIQGLEAEPGQFGSLYQWTVALVSYARQRDVAFLVGSEAWTQPRLDDLEGGGKKLGVGARFNSAYLVQGELPYQRYDKTTLTPFGEEIPYISAWPWLESKLVSLGAQGMQFNLEKGTSYAPLVWSRGDREVRLSIPICFEDMRSDVVRRMVWDGGERQSDVLVNLSNDGWFGSSVMSRMVHAQIARFRCVENGIPMVRSVNTGFSLSCDPYGRISRAVGHETDYGTPLEAGTFLVPLNTVGRWTVYGRVGDLWPAGCLCLTGVMTIFTIRFSRRSDGGSREGNQS